MTRSYHSSLPEENPHAATEWQRAQADLQASEERFRRMADNIRDGLTIIENGQVVYVNNRTCEIFGIPKDECTNFSSLDMVAPEEQTRLRLITAKANQTGILPKELEYWIIRKDGTRRHIHNRYAYSHQGETASLFVITTDITERTLAYQTMEQRVTDRTRQLATVLAVQQAITSRLDSEAVLQLIADEARQLTATAFSTVFLLDGAELYAAVLSGAYGPEMSLGHRIPLRQSAAGLAVLTGQPVYIADAQSDSRVHPDMARRMNVRSILSVPLISGTEPLGAISVGNKLAGTLGPDDERALMMLAPGAVIGLENARRYHEEQTRRREAEQRRQVAEGLRDLLTILNSNRPLAEILDHLIVRAGRLLGAEAVAIYRLHAEKGYLSVQAAQGLDEDYLAMQIPIGQDNGMRTAVRERKSIIIGDIEALLASPDESPQRLLPQAPLEQLARRFRSLITVPVIIKDEVYGGIALYYPQPRTFLDEEISLAAAFSDQAALAIENARLRDQAEQAAVAAERSRLARDLHDAVTQTLFSASLIADVLPRLWERNVAEGRRRLEELRQLTRGALAEMRTLLLELRPTALTEVGLGDLLRQLAEAFTGRARIPVTLTMEVRSPLPPDVQVALYRIAQEALNNVAKHAGASQVMVSLRHNQEAIELGLSDNGRGFDVDTVSAEHLGLGIMVERAEAVGATLKITSQVGQGTQVVVVWKDKAKPTNVLS